MARPSIELTTLQLTAAWQQKLHTSTGREITFGSLFLKQQDNESQAHGQQMLVIFIRHFFCGYCQDYLRHLAEVMPPTSLPESLKVTIVGCGAYTLIDSYRSVTSCPDSWAIFSDSTTRLYDLLGMHRSLSLGNKSPAYVQHSMALGMLKSALQGMKRIGHGDVRAAGDWSVQGGEFLFKRQAQVEQEWTLTWSHRMRNSRDHTEVEQLMDIISLDVPSSPPTESPCFRRANKESVVSPDQTQLGRTSSLRRSLSLRRDKFVAKAGRLARSTSLRHNATVQVT